MGEALGALAELLGPVHKILRLLRSLGEGLVHGIGRLTQGLTSRIGNLTGDLACRVSRIAHHLLGTRITFKRR